MSTESVPKVLIQLQVIFDTSSLIGRMNVDQLQSLAGQTSKLIDAARERFEICMEIVDEELFNRRCDYFEQQFESSIGAMISSNTASMYDMIGLRARLEETIDLIRKKTSH